MKYIWHITMMEFHFCMCYVWNFPYHYRKWRYHGKKAFEIKGLDYDREIKEYYERKNVR